MKGTKLRWQNLSFDFARIYRLYPEPNSLHWFDRTYWTDSNGWNHSYATISVPLHIYGHGFMTEVAIHDIEYAAVGMQIVRNADISQISGDVFQNSSLVLNNTLHNVDTSVLEHHTDVFQYFAPADTRLRENVIGYNVKGTDIFSQHFFMRTGGGGTFKDFAFVNIELQPMANADLSIKPSQLWCHHDHVLFMNVTTPYKLYFREVVGNPDEGYIAHNVLFEHVHLHPISVKQLQSSPPPGITARSVFPAH